VQAVMFACIDEDERETAPPLELALHPSNVVSYMVTFSVEVDRLHSDVENATKRWSIGGKLRIYGKGHKGQQTWSLSENWFPIEIPMKEKKSPKFSRDTI
jgi:hypothetical protein